MTRIHNVDVGSPAMLQQMFGRIYLLPKMLVEVHVVLTSMDNRYLQLAY